LRFIIIEIIYIAQLIINFLKIYIKNIFKELRNYFDEYLFEGIESEKLEACNNYFLNINYFETLLYLSLNVIF